MNTIDQEDVEHAEQERLQRQLEDAEYAEQERLQRQLEAAKDLANLDL